jgi:hypothetical protein
MRGRGIKWKKTELQASSRLRRRRKKKNVYSYRPTIIHYKLHRHNSVVGVMCCLRKKNWNRDVGLWLDNQDRAGGPCFHLGAHS